MNTPVKPIKPVLTLSKTGSTTSATKCKICSREVIQGWEYRQVFGYPGWEYKDPHTGDKRFLWFGDYCSLACAKIAADHNRESTN
jgi:hypothetical protein